ncbi:MAG: 23S rRNA (pseudouridine(1915)-N(3))-methyltransferase RlmH [Gammaproteobacteria bacterium]|nr:23S rRNA (pseudouridine(1915)-N(3))-methyltransferase RlmH [Gammaproteobacteria bacterium]
MKYRLLVYGSAPDWVDRGVAEYAKRMPNFLLVRLSSKPVKTRMPRMFAACGKNCTRVALDKSGTSFTSEGLAHQCDTWERQGRDVCFLIGDDVGFSGDDLCQADLIWSLSALTLPHQLIRILVCEQLYRAHAINRGSAYHRP